MTIDELKDFLSKDGWSRGVALSKNGIKHEVREALISLTSFLPENTAITCRGWHVMHDLFSIQACEYCNSPVKWDNSYGRYPKYCSNKCTANSQATKDKKSATSLDRYGVECSLLNHEQQLKRSNTIKARYGVDHASQSDIVKDKVKATNLATYGVEHVLASPKIRDTIRETVMARYGVDHISKADAVKDKVIQTNLLRYGSEYYILTDEFRERYTETSIEKYGTTHPMRSAVIRDRIKATNLETHGVEFNRQRHIDSASLKLLNDAEWLRHKHLNENLFLYEIAEILGVHASTVANKFNQFAIPIEHRFTSKLENVIDNALQQCGIPYERNCRTAIAPYELDFFIPAKNLAIECNGLFWHSEIFKDSAYHSNKTKECSAKGIQLLQFFENEILDSPEIVEKMIKSKLGIRFAKTVYARQCTVSLVSTDLKRMFLTENHIQGDGPSSINVGLYYDDCLVACMCFIQHKDYVVLNRYATSQHVIGGFSRLLKHFEREYSSPKIVSFADLRISNGALYKDTGFCLAETMPPDYYWTKRTNIWHKFNWRHTTGLKKLKNYDKDKSEVENMHAHDYYRIWDCGKLKFVKNG